MEARDTKDSTNYLKNSVDKNQNLNYGNEFKKFDSKKKIQKIYFYYLCIIFINYYFIFIIFLGGGRNFERPNVERPLF